MTRQHQILAPRRRFAAALGYRFALRMIAGALVVYAGACSSSGDDDGDDTAGSGGTSAMMVSSGGTAAPGSGGTAAPGSGGKTGGGSGSGGTTAGGSGGAPMMTGSGGATMPEGDSGMPPVGAIACSAPKPNAKVGNECKGAAPPAIKLTMISDQLVGPVFAIQAPGDKSRLYVLEQQGTIRVIKDGTLNAEPLMDLRMLSGDAKVNSSGVDFIMYAEAGLLGMVFDPDFENTHRFWINYDKGSGFTTSVLRFEMTNPDKVDVSSGTELLTVSQPSFNHKGGMMAFGKDGCLYIGMGDGGMEGDPMGTGQGTSDELGVMLRVDVDKYPMAAPGNISGNIWSTGIRNPWRWSFDSLTGDMYFGEIGQDSGTGFEEVNVEPQGVGGRNYGWSVAEGSTVCNGDCTGFTKPAVEYATTGDANSVIGGYVYRGTKMPEMVGRYLYADWTERKIKTFIYKGETGGQAEVCDEFDTGVTVGQKVRAFGQDLDGELYVMASGSGSGLSGASPTSQGFLYKNRASVKIMDSRKHMARVAFTRMGRLLFAGALVLACGSAVGCKSGDDDDSPGSGGTGVAGTGSGGTAAASGGVSGGSGGTSGGSGGMPAASGGMSGGSGGMPAASGGMSGGSGGMPAPNAPTFTAIYTNIMTKGAVGNCTFGGCHGAAADNAGNGGLHMAAADKMGTYTTLTTAKSSSTACSGMSYVVPGDPEASLLLLKLRPDAPCGMRMPLIPLGRELTEAEMGQIETWIKNGAMND